MRLRHFEALRPVCPTCRLSGRDLQLQLRAEAGTEHEVRAGVLLCVAGCGQAFPIIDGIPILVPDLPTWLSNNLHLVLQKDVENESAEAAIGAMVGPDAAFNIVRQQQSTYGFGHYGDLSDVSGGPLREALAPGGLRDCLFAVQAGLGSGSGPILDIGCAVGGTTFHLCAVTSAPVLGIDLNWPLLRIARSVLDTGRLSYPLRRRGNAYERRTVPVAFPGAEQADFWIADVLALPFSPDTFGRIVTLNVLDCVSDPERMLLEMARALAAGGDFALTTPFDWASHATPPARWLAGPDAVCDLLAQDFNLKYPPEDMGWNVRLHDAATVHYRTHLFTGLKS